jgi:hypothetical protein
MPPKKSKLILNEESYLALNAWKIKDQLKNMYYNNNSLDNNIIDYHDEDLAELEMNNQQYDKNLSKNKNLKNSKNLGNIAKNNYFNEFNTKNNGQPISVRSSRIKDYEKNLRNFKKIVNSDEPDLIINEPADLYNYNKNTEETKKTGNLEVMKPLSKSENDVRKNINKSTKTTIIKPVSVDSESPKPSKTNLPKGWHRTTDESNTDRSTNDSNLTNSLNTKQKVFKSTSLATIAETSKSPSLKRFANNANMPKTAVELIPNETKKTISKIPPPKSKKDSMESPVNKKNNLNNKELLSKSENELANQKKHLMSVLAPIEKKLDEVIKKLNDINKLKNPAGVINKRPESPYVTMPVKAIQNKQEPIKSQGKVPTKFQVKQSQSKSPKPLAPNKSRESPIRETPFKPTPARATPVRPIPIIPLPQLQPVEKINNKPIQQQNSKHTMNQINDSDNLSLQPKYNNINGNYQNHSYNNDTRSLDLNLNDDFEIESVTKYKKFLNRNNNLIEQLSLNAGDYDSKNYNNYVPITGNYNSVPGNEFSILNRMYQNQSRQGYNNNF